MGKGPGGRYEFKHGGGRDWTLPDGFFDTAGSEGRRNH